MEEGFRVIRSSGRCSVRIAVIGALVAALGLAGCGRKSSLDPPPAASVAGQGPVQPDDAAGIAPDGRPVAPPPAQKRRFFLDWLLD